MNLIDYPNLVLAALRHAIAGLLQEVAEEGLPGDHHFFITFRTDAPGVEIPSSLHRDHPDELTIVLQHQFWDLAADADGFSVTLRFGGAPAHLRVPYTAMTAFADPSVEFGLQLAVPQAPLEVEAAEEAAPGPKAVPSATVIAFDRNRKRD
jgi:hypothetical protein